VTVTDIPDEIVEACRRRAEVLRTDPLFLPYASEY
jgi:hypothetical protein